MICPSCKRRKATDDDWEYFHAHYGKLSPLIDAVCLQEDDCILPPRIEWWSEPVTVSGPTGKDEAGWGSVPWPDITDKDCHAPLPGERP